MSRSPPSYQTDPRVDEYIDALRDWQQVICSRLRDLIHAADREVVETIKRTRQPYFVLHGNVCALLAAKDHVNVFLYDGAIVPDPHGIITAGHGNATARTLAYCSRIKETFLYPNSGWQTPFIGGSYEFLHDGVRMLGMIADQAFAGQPGAVDVDVAGVCLAEQGLDHGRVAAARATMALGDQCHPGQHRRLVEGTGDLGGGIDLGPGRVAGPAVEQLHRQIQVELHPPGRVLDALQRHPWPGNVRELHGVVREAMLHASGHTVLAEFLPADFRRTTVSEPGPKADLYALVESALASETGDAYGNVLTAVEQILIPRVLRQARGNLTQASERLGISRGTLRQKMRDLGLVVDKVCTEDSHPTED